MLGSDRQSIIKILDGIDLSQESVFSIEDLKTYYIIKCFLLSKEIPFNDEFSPTEKSFQELHRTFLEDPSDDNFLNALSHPLCSQHDQFYKYEMSLEFPKKPITQFDLSMKQVATQGNSHITLSREENGIHIENVNYYKFP